MASFRKFTARDKQNALECNGWLSLNVNYRGCLQKYCLRFITHELCHLYLGSKEKIICTP